MSETTSRASKRPRELCDAPQTEELQICEALPHEDASDFVHSQCRKAQRALIVAALSRLPKDVKRPGRLADILATPLPHPTEGTMTLGRRLERQAELFEFASAGRLETQEWLRAQTLPPLPDAEESHLNID
jgi:hypothetical protein